MQQQQHEPHLACQDDWQHSRESHLQQPAQVVRVREIGRTSPARSSSRTDGVGGGMKAPSRMCPTPDSDSDIHPNNLPTMVHGFSTRSHPAGTHSNAGITQDDQERLVASTFLHRQNAAEPPSTPTPTPRRQAAFSMDTLTPFASEQHSEQETETSTTGTHSLLGRLKTFKWNSKPNLVRSFSRTSFFRGRPPSSSVSSTLTAQTTATNTTPPQASPTPTTRPSGLWHRPWQSSLWGVPSNRVRATATDNTPNSMNNPRASMASNSSSYLYARSASIASIYSQDTTTTTPNSPFAVNANRPRPTTPSSTLSHHPPHVSPRPFSFNPRRPTTPTTTASTSLWSSTRLLGRRPTNASSGLGRFRKDSDASLVDVDADDDGMLMSPSVGGSSAVGSHVTAPAAPPMSLDDLLRLARGSSPTHDGEGGGASRWPQVAALGSSSSAVQSPTARDGAWQGVFNENAPPSLTAVSSAVHASSFFAGGSAASSPPPPLVLPAAATTKSHTQASEDSQMMSPADTVVSGSPTEIEYNSEFYDDYLDMLSDVSESEACRASLSRSRGGSASLERRLSPFGNRQYSNNVAYHQTQNAAASTNTLQRQASTTKNPSTTSLKEKLKRQLQQGPSRVATAAAAAMDKEIPAFPAGSVDYDEHRLTTPPASPKPEVSSSSINTNTMTRESLRRMKKRGTRLFDDAVRDSLRREMRRFHPLQGQHVFSGGETGEDGRLSRNEMRRGSWRISVSGLSGGGSNSSKGSGGGSDSSVVIRHRHAKAEEFLQGNGIRSVALAELYLEVVTCTEVQPYI